jgi:hypothetical protein
MSAEMARGLALVIIFLFPLGILSGMALLAPLIFSDWRTITPEARRGRLAWLCVGMTWIVAGLQLVTGESWAMYGGLALLFTGLMLLPNGDKQKNDR